LTYIIGKTGGLELVIGDRVRASVENLAAVFEGALPRRMKTSL